MASRIRPEIESPCVNICRMDNENRYCIGCWRTVEEIKAWSTMTSDERHLVLSKLEERAGL
ncbi:MAG: DUF1289 domain-containing protein [Fluviibacter sp.]